jgi:hypothetical protein
MVLYIILSNEQGTSRTQQPNIKTNYHLVLINLSSSPSIKALKAGILF